MDVEVAGGECHDEVVSAQQWPDNHSRPRGSVRKYAICFRSSRHGPWQYHDLTRAVLQPAELQSTILALSIHKAKTIYISELIWLWWSIRRVTEKGWQEGWVAPARPGTVQGDGHHHRQQIPPLPSCH